MFHSSLTKLDFKDVLIVPKKTNLKSRKNVCLQREIIFKNGKAWKGVPIISSNMDSVTSFETCRILRKHKFLSCLPKHLNKGIINEPTLQNELWYKNDYMLSCGTSQDDFETLKKLVNKIRHFEVSPLFVCVDVANGYMGALGDTVSKIRDTFPQLVIAAGNVVTPEAVVNLIGCGADIVKVGIGSGSVCETRLKAGVGYPQFSAVSECSVAARAFGGYIISDGGIIYPCDIVKAFGAGADFVMCGSMFAGHEESPGESIDGKKIFYGMSSEIALNKYNEGTRGYRTSEGKAVVLTNKGPLEYTIMDIEGSIRSACTYTNSEKIEELYSNVQFIKVNNHHNTSL